MKSLIFVLNTKFLVLKIFQKTLWIYKNGKSEPKNSLKLLKNQLNCFHKFFLKKLWICKTGKSELQNSLKSRKNWLNQNQLNAIFFNL